jgi:hypothetical protein
VKCSKHFSDFADLKSAADKFIPGLPALSQGISKLLTRSKAKQESLETLLDRLIRIANNDSLDTHSIAKNLLYNFISLDFNEVSKPGLKEFIKEKVIKK